VSISYERGSSSHIEDLAPFLTDAGVAIWYDGAIPTGGRWDDTIRDHIDTCARRMMGSVPKREQRRAPRRTGNGCSAFSEPATPSAVGG
jgi:hypothetical protein